MYIRTFPVLRKYHRQNIRTSGIQSESSDKERKETEEETSVEIHRSSSFWERNQVAMEG